MIGLYAFLVVLDVGTNNLNSKGSSSSVYNLSQKYILLILQLACIVSLKVST